MQKYEVYLWQNGAYIRWSRTATLIYSTLWHHHRPQLETFTATGVQFKFKRAHESRDE